MRREGTHGVELEGTGRKAGLWTMLIRQLGSLGLSIDSAVLQVPRDLYYRTVRAS